MRKKKISYARRLELSNQWHENRIKKISNELDPDMSNIEFNKKYDLIRYHRGVITYQDFNNKIANKEVKRKIYKERQDY